MDKINSIKSKFYHYCYDATIALAIALNRTTEGFFTIEFNFVVNNRQIIL